MTKKRKWAVMMVILFFIWGGISYQWYSCGIKGFCVEPAVTQKQVKVIPDTCSAYINTAIKVGAQNDAIEVQKLESFLKNTQGANIMVNGFYGFEDEQAVKAFQEKYRSEVLDPWGMAQPSGYVFTTTRNKINQLYCAMNR